VRTCYFLFSCRVEGKELHFDQAGENTLRPEIIIDEKLRKGGKCRFSIGMRFSASKKRGKNERTSGELTERTDGLISTYS
jgi:hypothetical protein